MNYARMRLLSNTTVIVVAVATVASASTQVSRLHPFGRRNPQALQRYDELPLSFEANDGQTDSDVLFLSRTHGYTLFLTNGGAILALGEPSAKDSALRMSLAGANPSARVSGAELLPGKSN